MNTSISDIHGKLTKTFLITRDLSEAIRFRFEKNSNPIVPRLRPLRDKYELNLPETVFLQVLCKLLKAVTGNPYEVLNDLFLRIIYR